MDNPLAYGQDDPTSQPNPLMAGAGPAPAITAAQAPTSADAYSTNMQASLAWLNHQRALSAMLGLADPDTGLPTKAGLVDAARQVAGGIMMGTSAPGDAPGFVAYHGSPHDFPPTPTNPLGAFDTSRIGTGQGAQEYGHGLYLAENEGVARSYRDDLAQKDYSTSAGGRVPDWVGNSIKQIGDQFGTDSPLYGKTIDRHIGDFETRLAEAQKALETSHQPWQVQDQVNNLQGILGDLNKLRTSDATLLPRGRMYEVRVNADPAHFLDWDKPLSEQSPLVQKVVTDAGIKLGPSATGEQVYNAIAGLNPRSPAARQSASEVLQAAGIPGIRYLDQGSRATGKGTYNHVIFDAGTLEILRKYGIAGLMAGGGAAAAGTQGQPTD